MDDLISRQAAINKVEMLAKKYFDHPVILRSVRDMIEQLPSAQPEIIRCKDCKYHRRDGDGCYYCCRKDYGYGWGLNDFCSDAER